ncbi:MAG: transcription-repair coupling factor, partial [Clostridia bacterium]|nr:transcription-repair coupling factor [Clostridia bacterium]
NNYLKLSKSLTDTISTDKASLTDTLAMRFDKMIENIEKGATDYLSIAYADNVTSTIYDYLPNNTTIAFNGTKSIYDAISSYVNLVNTEIDSAIKQNELPKQYRECKLSLDTALTFKPYHTLLAYQYINQANKLFNPNKVFNIKTLPQTNYNYDFSLLSVDISNYLKEGYTCVVYAKSDEGAVKLSKHFESKGLAYVFCNMFSSVQKGVLNIIPKPYPLQVLLPLDKIAIFSSSSIFVETRTKKVFKNTVAFDEELPKVNDIVVHSVHGIGKCLGIECLNLSNSYRDYVVIEYKNKDILYLPVENISDISKYVGSDKLPALSKLGGADFAKVKTKVKSHLKDEAHSLISIYKERMGLQGITYPQDDEFQEVFESNFGFIETEDQIKAIKDIKNEMHTGKLIDRLVCGDVGFGKTEVAIRIAFKTVLAGYQVAVLCPTTILSEQHYNTFKLRMENFGIKVEVLNRFKKDSEVKDILDRLASGDIDVICGTHKLLGSSVIFKKLGLLILDEEQKFGVKDKESIKEKKKGVNVITLSATPIPRTLHMSLSGIRDISVIETPPVSRIPTEVQVVEYNDMLIKTAVDREINRHGQVLIIYNKVETIDHFASHIRNIVGDSLSIYIAHGQMDEKTLEKAILKLYNGDTDILISTTLIENGVDLPNANTLIVIDSDTLGLSQLYQLKGRIGRSDRQAFAYFTYNASKILTENAYKRLEAITEFAGLGSGFKIAMRDLEIRGAGNVLGLEQHGHMMKVGYHMYITLLNQAIEELKGGTVENLNEVRVETNLDAYISKDLVNNYTSRITLYSKIAAISSMDSMLAVEKLIIDTFGTLPIEIENLCKIAYIKNMASKLSICRVVIKKNKSGFYFSKDATIKESVIEGIKEFEDNLKLSIDSSTFISVDGINHEKMLDFMINYLEFVSNS